MFWPLLTSEGHHDRERSQAVRKLINDAPVGHLVISQAALGEFFLVLGKKASEPREALAEAGRTLAGFLARSVVTVVGFGPEKGLAFGVASLLLDADQRLGNTDAIVLGSAIADPHAVGLYADEDGLLLSTTLKAAIRDFCHARGRAPIWIRAPTRPSPRQVLPKVPDTGLAHRGRRRRHGS